MRYTASKTQMHALSLRMELAVNLGDLSAFIRAQSLLMIFESNTSITDTALQTGKSSECIRLWLASFLSDGIRSLAIKKPRGRQPKLSKSQCKELKEIVSNPPYNAGYSGGCWNAAMILNLIKKMFKVTFSVKYLPQLLGRIGLSYQKAKYLPAKAKPKTRKEWLEKTWPKILAKAKRQKAMLFFGDEASFALWGSLGYTWATRGKQPLIPTNGNRRSLKVFGVIDYFSGKLISQTVEGKLNGERYIKFLSKVLLESSEKVIIVQDGAPYHRSKIVKEFISANSKRLSTSSLPSYSPDFNPIECVWRKIKRAATHNIYFEDFSELKETVQKQLRKLKQTPGEILALFDAYKEMKLKPALS